MHHDFFDAPALRRHLELQLRVREAVHFAVEPRLGHLEMRDEPLAIAGRHRAGERRRSDRDGQGNREKGSFHGATLPDAPSVDQRDWDEPHWSVTRRCTRQALAGT